MSEDNFNWRKETERLNNSGRLDKSSGVPFEFMTVAEYIKQDGIKTERRISKNGAEIIKVFYPSGVVKEYPASQIETTAARDV